MDGTDRVVGVWMGVGRGRCGGGQTAREGRLEGKAVRRFARIHNRGAIKHQWAVALEVGQVAA